MELEQTSSGLFIPKQKSPEPEKKKYVPVKPLVDTPTGNHPDGSLTLCPEVMKIVRHRIKNQHSCGIVAPQKDFMDELMEALWLHQGIGFEQYT